MDSIKFPAFLSLMPADNLSMNSHLCDIFSSEIVNKAVLHRLKECCSQFYQKRFSKAQDIAEEVLDYSWEALNTGHWKNVSQDNRLLYSFASLFKAISLVSKANSDNMTVGIEICRLCDMALLMGAPILDDIFNKIIEIYKPCSRKRKATSADDVKKYKVASNLDIKTTERVRSEHEPEVLHVPSLETFKQFMIRKQPAVLQGTFDHWPATKLWSLDYLRKVAGHRTVPVEIGSKYTEDDWGQQLMTIGQFIDAFVSPDSPSNGYLAQHMLFDQVPQLRDDIIVPDYCSISSNSDSDVNDDDVDINAWFGPAGTVSPCHHDPKHNILCQVVGRKYVRLYPPEYSDSLYPHGGDSVLTNTSQVDVEKPDLTSFPRFEEVDQKHCLEFVLLPGQALYIPPKHWHYIRSLDVSFSVSFWWE